MSEIWKDIEGYEGLYQVSNLGNVKSMKRIYKHNYFGKETLYKISEEKLLTKNINQGYEHVILSKDGKTKQKLVHRLIAKAFIPNPLNKPNINHIDGNGLNNSIENLEWCTQKENVVHAIKKLGMKDNYKYYVDRNKRSILQLNKKTNEFIAVYDSIQDASKILNISIEQIRRYCRGTSNNNEYTFKYLEVLKYEK